MTSIQLATPADVPQIARLGNRDAPWINMVRPQLARGQLSVFLASQAAKPVGYAIFQPRLVSPSPATGWRSRLASMRHRRSLASPVSLLRPMRIATVQEVFVRADYRHRGIGTTLISYGIEHARTSGIDDMRVNLAAADAGLDRFYQRLGFVPIQAYLTKFLTVDTFNAPPTHPPDEPTSDASGYRDPRNLVARCRPSPANLDIRVSAPDGYRLAGSQRGKVSSPEHSPPSD